MHFMVFIALGIVHSLEKSVVTLTSKDEIIEAFCNFYELDFLEIVKNLCDL